MKLPTIECARAVRDTGIDAMAALNQGLRDALLGLPEQSHADLKMMFGRLMAQIAETLIDKPIAQYAELEPDEATWSSVATGRAAARAAAGK
jgi:hypothetical protein